jgi:putative proteasome-type protease
MTYCLGFLLNSGLVLASDSRTNAGVDYISAYSKMHVFQPAGDRLFVLLAAGNLGTTHAVVNRIERDIDRHQAADPIADTQAASGPADLLTARYLFEAADYIGRTSVEVQREFTPSALQAGASGSASFLLGGQIKGDEIGLHLIYPQGNSIMATVDTPYLQIGETKYGKPPLDYVGRADLCLEDAARLCLVSQIITQRANLTVGPPFEVVIIRRDELKVARRLKLHGDAPEINLSMKVWAESMMEGLNRLPRFSWEEDEQA